MAKASYRYNSKVRYVQTKTELGMEMAIRLALEDIRRTAAPMTPRKTGELRSSAVIRQSEGVVNWTADHAEILEKKQFANYTTAGTGPHFAERAVRQVTQRFDQHLRAAGVI